MYVLFIIRAIGISVYSTNKKKTVYNYIAVILFFLANGCKLHELSYDYSYHGCVLILLNTGSIFFHGRIIEMKK